MQQSSGTLCREGAKPRVQPGFECQDGSALVPRTLRSASSAVRCVASGHERTNAVTPHSVIASAAKQSRLSTRKDSGLLRCARN